jgi:hypothetical protein
MYPSTELDTLALRKLLICSRIRVRRHQCAQAAARVAVPVAWIDRAWAQWKSISPLVKLAAVPLGFMMKKRFLPQAGKIGFLGKLLRWAPLATGAWRMFSGMQRGR